MKVESVSYQEVRNLGNYQTCRAEATVKIDEDDWKITYPSPHERAMDKAKKIVREALGLPT